MARAKESEPYLAHDLSWKPSGRKVFQSSEDVAAYFGPRLKALSQERMYVVMLDSRNRVVKIVLAAQGSIHAASLAPADIFRPALRTTAAVAAIILVHNHPSGDPTPSHLDWTFTQRMRDAGNIIGIPIVDHVIVGRDGSASLHFEKPACRPLLLGPR